MKKVLIITYYWPPSGGSGVQRWLKFVKYFRDFGIEPIVLTVNPAYATFPNHDYSLLEEIPDGIEIHYTKAKSPFELYKKVRKKEVPQSGFSGEKKTGLIDKMMRFIRGNFFIPDARIGWNEFAYNKAVEIIKKQQINTIITTSPPHSTQLIGLKLKAQFKLNWIVDLRDPWTEIYYNQELFRTTFAKQKDYKLEQMCLKNADKIIVVSEDIKRHFSANRSEIAAKIHVIPNGFDETDFLKIQNRKLKIENKIISYVGNLGEQYPIEEFLEAFADLVKTHPNWKLQFVGNCYAGVKHLTERLGISESVEFISYVNHSEAIHYMINASVLLLIIPKIENNKGILTGKLFEYLATGNPILNIGPKDGDAAAILRDHATSITVNPNEKASILEFILNSTSKTSTFTPISENKFSRKSLTGEVARLIIE